MPPPPDHSFSDSGTGSTLSASLSHGDLLAHRPSPWSGNHIPCNTYRWKWWTVSDKSPAPAPAYSPDPADAPPAPLQLSYRNPDERTSDMEPDTAFYPASHSWHCIPSQTDGIHCFSVFPSVSERNLPHAPALPSADR